MQHKATIFDMDGLLIDSMSYWLALDREVFASHGLEFEGEALRYMTGRSEKENMEYLEEKFGIDTTHLMASRHDHVLNIYKDLTKEMPGLGRLMDVLRESEYRYSLASGASLDLITIVADRFGWNDFFEFLISSDHVDSIGKPDPGIYLYAAEKMKLSPEDCIVFEDSENGVVAAKRAGMRCIAVPNAEWSPGDFSQADLVADSLEDKRIFEYLNL